MPNHIFRHKDRYEFFSVMNCERMSDHIWDNGGPPRPGFNDLSILILIHPLNFLQQMVVNKCTLTY